MGGKSVVDADFKRQPRFDPDTKSLMLLSKDNVPGATFVDPELYQGDCYNR